MIKPLRTFKGGYKFKNYAGQPLSILEDAKIPPRVIIPLRQGFGTEVRPLVRVGEKVSAGQIIGRDDTSVSSPVHSSVNGIVEEIKRTNYFKRESTMVMIRTTDFSPEVLRLDGYSAQWWNLSNERIEELVYLSGVSALDREGIPTHFKSSIISPEDVNQLIIHAIGSEPYNISLDILFEKKNLLNFFEGVKILKRLMPKSKVHLVVNRHKRRIVEELVKLSSDLEWVDIYPLEPKFPQGYDEILVPTILNQKFPYGYSAANIGVVVLNAQAVLGVYGAVACGKPFIERIIALCGNVFTKNIHIRARVGTPLSDIVGNRIISKTPARVVMNSLLTGFNLNDFSLPVDKTFSQIIAIPEKKEREFLAFVRSGAKRDSYTRTFLAQWLIGISRAPDTNLHGEERPCISCGFCEEICPVRIIPHLLSRLAKRGFVDETLMNYNIFSCIECGLCNFVCPSKISLMQHIKEAQEKLIIQGCDRNQCILPYFNLKGIEEYRGVTKL